MKITSDLSKGDYLTALKDRMGSRFSFGQDRFTGLFLGSLFSVTYHAGHEENRRVTNEKHSALGFVRKAPQGCEVCFIRTWGMLYPTGFLTLILLCFVVFLMSLLSYPEDLWDIFWVCIPFCLGLSTILALVTAFRESLTDRSEEVAGILLACLRDPEDPFSYLNHRNEL